MRSSRPCAATPCPWPTSKACACSAATPGPLPLFVFLLGLAGMGCGGGGAPGRAANDASLSDGAAAAADTPSAAAASPASADTGGIAVGGFQTPESVLHDPVADVYIVSNINGEALDRDDNGFLSRVSPAGELLDLKWIDGAADDVTLNAPKGLAMRGDTLFVADIDSVRLFGRETGAPLGAWAVPGASFLNDLATAPDGTLYVTDTGVTAGASGLEPAGTDALYRFEGVRPIRVAGGSDMGGPNGVAADGGRVLLVTFGSGKLFRVGENGDLDEIPQAAMGQLDGVVILEDGSIALSSWEKGAVYRYWSEGDRQGRLAQVGAPIESPADIGYDAARRRILVPSFLGNRVESRPVGP